MNNNFEASVYYKKIVDQNLCFRFDLNELKMAPLILMQSQTSSMKETRLMPMQRPSNPPTLDRKLIQVCWSWRLY